MNEEIEDGEVSFLKTDKEFLSLTEVCLFFGKCRHTIVRWRREENFPEPHVMSTRSLIFETQLLRDWLENKKRNIEKQNPTITEKANKAKLPDEVKKRPDIIKLTTQRKRVNSNIELNKQTSEKEIY